METTTKVNFLGQRGSLRSGESDQKIQQKIQSINGFINVQGTSPEHAIANLDLGISGFFIYNILNDIVLVTKENSYYPLNISLMYKYNGRVASMVSQNFVYLNKVGRPNPKFVMNKLSQLLANNYTGGLEVEIDRYVFDFKVLPVKLIASWLKLAREGDGTIIDYTWIDPFISLIEPKTTRKPRFAKEGKIQMEDTEEAYIPPPTTATLPYGWPTFPSGSLSGISTSRPKRGVKLDTDSEFQMQLERKKVEQISAIKAKAAAKVAAGDLGPSHIWEKIYNNTIGLNDPDF